MTSYPKAMIGAAFAATLSSAALLAQAPSAPAPQPTRAAGLAHIAAAKKAAGYEVAELFDHTCARLLVGAALPFGRIYPPATRDAAQWSHEPVKVFDNLYYLGERMLHGASPSAWAVTTSAGIILIDTMFEDSMQALIVGGLKKVNLDPANIKYIILTHGHGDHINGAPFLQATYKPRLIMGGPDWDALDRNTNATTPRPTRDISAVDGQQVTLGDTSVSLYLTPGHTAGTLALLIPVKDGGRTHLAALWGGTGMQFSAEEYHKSAVRFRDIAAKAGADVILSTHPQLDKSDIKLPMLAKRQPGDPHPWVVGADVVRSYMTVAAECSAAAVALPAEYKDYLGRGGGRGGRGAGAPAGRGVGAEAAPVGRGQ
jgi:metallo-beta-lactamase class B